MLILETDKTRFPPHWVPAELLLGAIKNLKGAIRIVHSEMDRDERGMLEIFCTISPLRAKKVEEEAEREKNPNGRKKETAAFMPPNLNMDPSAIMPSSRQSRGGTMGVGAGGGLGGTTPKNMNQSQRDMFREIRA